MTQVFKQVKKEANQGRFYRITASKYWVSGNAFLAKAMERGCI